jgi:hypothetical protein
LARAAFEPLTSLFIEALRAESPDAGAPPSPPPAIAVVDRLSSAASLRTWLESLGLGQILVEERPHSVGLTPDLAWKFVQGSLMAGRNPSDPQVERRVKDRFLSSLNGVRLNANTLIASARKP